MTVDPRQFIRLEALPGEFEPELQALDARLHQAIGGGSCPAGLSDRVFMASVDSLPGAGRLRLVGTEFARRTTVSTRWGSRQVWARLAMAAGLVVALGTGMWLVQHNPGQGGTRLAMETSPAVTGAAVALALESMPQGDTAELEGRVSHLLETNEMSSFDELASELSTMVAALQVEM